MDADKKVMTIFVGLGIILMGLVVGVPILQAMFATGGPFGQLISVTEGECIFTPAVLGNVPPDAVPPPLPFRVTVPPGTPFEQVLLPDITQNDDAPTAGSIGYGWIEPGTNTSGSLITANFHRTLTVSGTAYTISAETAAFMPFGTACNPQLADRPQVSFNHPATTNGGYASDQNVGFMGSENLSANPYSGILIALILLIPLGIIAFFAMRFFSSRVA